MRAGNRHQIVAGESCKSNTKTIDSAGGSSKSGSANGAFMQVWHKLHVMLWFGACADSLCTDSTGLLYRRIVELNSNSFLRLQ